MIYDSMAGNISIAVTGDALVSRPFSMFTEPAFLELAELLRSADASVTNAEMLFHNYEDPPAVAPGGTYLRADPAILGELEWFGINLLAAANNHNYDHGENGLLTHLSNLAKSGMVYAGVGRNLGEAREPRYLETRGGRVALIAATSSGPAHLFAAHQWRDGMGRPGANMIRYGSHYTVDAESFEAMRRFRDQFGLGVPISGGRSGLSKDHSWGLSATPDSADEFYMRDLHDQWQYPVPDGYRIVRGESFERHLHAVTEDLAENAQRIRDAKRQADWVVVSMHNHEGGATLDDPPDVAVEFAHAAIDAGADVFHGHGPHRDRGIEIYNGKPIFYSIGHLIYQNNTIQKVPLENMRRIAADPWEATPADFFDSREGDELNGEWGGSNTSPEKWRDIVAIVEFRGGELSEVRLHPIELGFRLPRGQRGRPVLSRSSEGEEVLRLFQRLSEPFGTTIEIKRGVGYVRL